MSGSRTSLTTSLTTRILANLTAIIEREQPPYAEVLLEAVRKVSAEMHHERTTPGETLGMDMLSPAESHQIIALHHEGYRFARRPDGVLVRNQDGSVVGLFSDMRSFLAFVGATRREGVDGLGLRADN